MVLLYNGMSVHNMFSVKSCYLKEVGNRQRQSQILISRDFNPL